MATTYYVSITGLQVKSWRYYPKFWYHAASSMIQAQQADGNLLAQSTAVKGVQHTLSVWKDRKSMTRFMASGAHAQAMKVLPEIAAAGGTKVYGYESSTIPTWEEALKQWNQHAKLHGRFQLESATESRSKGIYVATAVVLCVGYYYLTSTVYISPLVSNGTSIM